MTMTEHDLRELWRGRPASAAGDRGPCVTDDMWARLASGDATAAERTQVASHVARCADCADAYRVVDEFRPWMGEAAGTLSAGAPSAREGRARSAPRLPVWFLAAASLLIGLLGIGFYVVWQNGRQRALQLEARLADARQSLSAAEASLAQARERLGQTPASPGPASSGTGPSGTAQSGTAAPSEPLLDVPIVDLDPIGGGTTRGTRSAPDVVAPPDAGAVTLILNFPPLAAASTLSIEIASAADAGAQRASGIAAPGWSRRTERAAGAASLNLTLPRHSYPPGRYVIRLSNAASGAEVATYRITLR
jgi:hypothetical protein